MKLSAFYFICFVCISSLGVAQNIRIEAYAAYGFQDRFDSYYERDIYYEGRINGGLQWGAGLEYMLRSNMGLELLFLHQDTNAPTYYQGYDDYNVNYADFDLKLDYIMLSGNHYFRPQNSSFEGFGGLGAGVLIANIDNPKNGNSDTATKFAWSAKLGGIYWISNQIGIKAQLQLLSAVQAIGGGFYFGYYGPSAGLSSYSTLYQFSLGGGLVFQL